MPTPIKQGRQQGSCRPLFFYKTNPPCAEGARGILIAEGVGFEPTRPFRATVFETVPLSHSGTPPYQYNIVRSRASTENDPTRADAKKLDLILLSLSMALRCSPIELEISRK